MADFNFWSQEWAAAKTHLLRLDVLGGNDPRPRNNESVTPATQAIAKLEAKVQAANVSFRLSALQSWSEQMQSCVEALHAQEQKSKQRFEQMKAKHTQRQSAIDANYHNKTLLPEFYQIATKAESRKWDPWQTNRDRQQRQFQVSMQIRQDAETTAATIAKALKQPALMQVTQRSLDKFFHESMASIAKLQTDLENGSHGSLLQVSGGS